VAVLLGTSKMRAPLYGTGIEWNRSEWVWAELARYRWRETNRQQN